MSKQAPQDALMSENKGSESPKVPYRATFTWNPPLENPDLSPEPIDGIPVMNVQRKKFEFESNRLQEKLREDLSRQRKNERQKKMDA